MKSPRNYNVKPPKLGGGQGIPASTTIAKALGVSVGMPVHAGSVQRLTEHPDSTVSKAARKLMKRFI